MLQINHQIKFKKINWLKQFKNNIIKNKKMNKLISSILIVLAISIQLIESRSNSYHSHHQSKHSNQYSNGQSEQQESSMNGYGQNDEQSYSRQDQYSQYSNQYENGMNGGGEQYESEQNGSNGYN